MKARNPYHPVGTLGGKSYVEREADVLLRRAVVEEDMYYPYMLAARQSGKSSALTHLKRTVDSERIRVAIIDLSTFPAAELADEARFIRHFVFSLADALELSKEVRRELRDAQDDPGFLRHALTCVLAALPGRLVVCIDEVDVLQRCRFRDEFLSSIRWFFNARAESEVFTRVQFVLAGATSVEALISDPNRSPFNVGAPIPMGPLDLDGMVRLVRLGWPGTDRELKAAASVLLEWTGGSPFLSQHVLSRAFQAKRTAAARRPEDEISRALQETIRDAPSQIHFRNIYELIRRDAQLVEAWVAWRQGYRISETDMGRLCMAGLSSEAGPVRCRLYEHVFGPGGPLRIGGSPSITLTFERHGDTQTWTVAISDGAGSNADTVVITPGFSERDHEDIRWYLEDFLDLPDGGALVRAQRVEEMLVKWGRRQFHDLFSSARARQSIRDLMSASGDGGELVIASGDPEILRLPWELLADDAGPLAHRISVRRQVEAPGQAQPRLTRLPLRILYIVSRPTDTPFLDPRLTAKSLFAALDPLDDLVRVDFCRPATLARMEKMLREGKASGDPYDLVHFDGHGSFLPRAQIGALCFEKPDHSTGGARTDSVRADRLGELLAGYQVPVVVLEASRSAGTRDGAGLEPVAPRLIHSGVSSVVAMSNGMHPQAGWLFFDRFYRELVRGSTIGQAVAQARITLRTAPGRWVEPGPRGRSIPLLDWFLPHLYQQGPDTALFAHDAASQPRVPRYDVYLSHNHADSARVAALARQLAEQHGLHVWLDAWECGPGRLEPQCEAGIRDSRYTVVIVSRAAARAGWVAWQISRHAELHPEGGRMLPILMEQVDRPSEPGDLASIDFTDPARDAENAARLAAYIRSADAENARRRRGFRPPPAEGEPGAFPRPPRYGFQGRARELYELERRFRDSRGIVLHAMGGMGKTTLATEAAQWWTRSGLFRDGACFVSFEQFTSAERVVQILGAYCEGPRFDRLPSAEQRRRAVDLFRDRAVLMVWDNYESTLPQFSGGAAYGYTEEERERLSRLFNDLTTGPGKGCVLVTCRPGETGLRGAQKMELQGLARPDSLWLLQRILERDRLSLDDPRLARENLDPLLDDLADHPLSLELVGPHLRTLPPEAIRTDFGKLLRRFRQDAPEERNTSLLASLEFSRRHLSPAAREALPWLGLFSGGVFEEILLDASGIEPAAWAEIRAELEGIALLRAENELLVSGRPFLRFHPTLASASTEPGLAEQPHARERFIQVYFALRQALHQALHGSRSLAALKVLSLEEANYRTAVQWAVAAHQLRPAAAMGETFREYLERSGRLRERDTWVQWLREALTGLGFTEEGAVYERQHAWSLLTRGDPDAAVSTLETLIERLRHTTEFDPRFQLAATITTLGRVLSGAGASAQAIDALREAIRLWESLVEEIAGRSWEERVAGSGVGNAAAELGNLAATMGDLANALLHTGRYDEALATAEKTLLIQEKQGDDRELAAGYALCASILTAAGRHQEADASYDLALATAKRAGDSALEAAILQHQGNLACELDQLSRATQLYHQALRRFQEAADGAGVLSTCNLIGVAEVRAGRLTEALAWYEKSRELATERRDQVGLSRAALNMAAVRQMEGEAARERGDEPATRRLFEEARRLVEESLQIQKALGNRVGEGGSQSQLARIHLVLGDFAAAERHAHEARMIHEALGLRDTAKDYATLGEIAQARGDDTAAAEWARKRDDLLSERGDRGGGWLPAEALNALQALALACARAGFGDAGLEPTAEDALAQLDGFPEPFPEFAMSLRQLSQGQLPPVRSTWPPELQRVLESVAHTIQVAQRR